MELVIHHLSALPEVDQLQEHVLEVMEYVVYVSIDSDQELHYKYIQTSL